MKAFIIKLVSFVERNNHEKCTLTVYLIRAVKINKVIKPVNVRVIKNL